MKEAKRTGKGMPDFLAKVFIEDYQNINSAKVRGKYGKLSSITGIIVNLLLFGAKFTAGTLTGSISIAGDAFNNLSDAGSSVISLASFKMCNKPADYDHPFGHARIEYISSSVVAVIILFIGLELLKTSFGKIVNPAPVDFNLTAFAILTFSILMKLWLYRFNIKLGKRIDSTLLQATATDSLSDTLATSAVLISALISRFGGLRLDGYMGAVVAIFIIYSGIKILKKTISSILGQGPSKDSVNKIESFIRKYNGVMGLHDLVVHDYGPKHCFASVHVEVDSSIDIMQSHDLIDNIERDIELDHGIHLVIHLDPIVVDDPLVNELQSITEKIVSDIDSSLSIHDFRVVKGATHNNLIFDVTIPYGCKVNENKIQEEITKRIEQTSNNLYVVLTVDRSYVSTRTGR